ncbi:MAG: DUF6444 domain-containing protein [Bacteroidetes bacterium]|nr:DUF6444 domain-containing protein [Bacteroidota bacterium]
MIFRKPVFFEYKIQQDRIVELEQQLKELEQQLKKNSTNSHKPSSTDVFRKPIQNNREKSEKKHGAQPGHKGTTLKMVEKPDKIINRTVDGKCNCGRDLSKQDLIAIH